MPNLRISIYSFVIAAALAGSCVAAQASVHKVVPNSVTYTCLAQVSVTELYPETIDSDGGFTQVPGQSGTATLGQESVTAANITLAASKCHAFTRTVYKANHAWSQAAMVCARYAPGGNTLTFLVYATDYFVELGNGGGVNRDDGLAAICAPTTTIVIPHTL